MWLGCGALARTRISYGSTRQFQEAQTALSAREIAAEREWKRRVKYRGNTNGVSAQPTAEQAFHDFLFQGESPTRLPLALPKNHVVLIALMLEMRRAGVRSREVKPVFVKTAPCILY